MVEVAHVPHLTTSTSDSKTWKELLDLPVQHGPERNTFVVTVTNFPHRPHIVHKYDLDSARLVCYAARNEPRVK